MYRYFKRLFDFCIALVALLLIGWFLLIVAVGLLFANKKAGVFFFQERPGKDAKIFKVIKFNGTQTGICYLMKIDLLMWGGLFVLLLLTNCHN